MKDGIKVLFADIRAEDDCPQLWVRVNQMWVDSIVAMLANQIVGHAALERLPGSVQELLRELVRHELVWRVEIVLPKYSVEPTSSLLIHLLPANEGSSGLERVEAGVMLTEELASYQAPNEILRSARGTTYQERMAKQLRLRWLHGFTQLVASE